MVALADCRNRVKLGLKEYTNEQGSFLGCMVRWAHLGGTRGFYPALAALVRPVQNSFFHTEHYFSSMSTSPSKLGKQLCRVVCLLVCVSDGDCTKAEFRNLDKSLKSFPPCYSHNSTALLEIMPRNLNVIVLYVHEFGFYADETYHVGVTSELG